MRTDHGRDFIFFILEVHPWSEMPFFVEFQSRGRLQKLPRLFFCKIFRVSDMNIVLIGYRCSGKSLVGKILTNHLGLELVDTDRVLEKRIGSGISDYVAENGWEAFRMLEKMIVRSVSTEDQTIIATGGGAVLDWENVRNIKRMGWVVWLRASAWTIRERMTRDERSGRARPALAGENPMAEIEQILTQRIPLYERACDYAADTDRKSPEAVAKEIIQSMPEPMPTPQDRRQPRGIVPMAALNP